jgi:UDP-hydrolysing UDP-N-acetyl-D-glucosamine 2-epimerase
MARKICVFTGSRAEYGLLTPLLREIQSDKTLAMQLVVSGSHLASEFGETWRDIEHDNFRIDAKIDMQLRNDAPIDLAKSMALCLAGCAEQFDRLKPDILTVLGDRYETLAAAEAAMMLRIPIAHIHGGEATEGAMDDAIRHAITKLSHLHFAAAEPYRQRILQRGEDPARVFNVGAPGIDHIVTMARLGRADLERDLNFRFARRNLLVTLHPETVGQVSPAIPRRACWLSSTGFPISRLSSRSPMPTPAGGTSIGLWKLMLPRIPIEY